MCLTVAIRRGPLAWVAADLRWGWYRADGSGEFWDLGGKVARVPGGAVAISGDSYIGSWALQILQRKGVEEPAVVPAVLRELVQEHGESLRERLPDARPEETAVIGAVRREGGPDIFGYWAGGQELHEGSHILSWPPGLSEDEKARAAIVQEHERAWQAARTPRESLEAIRTLFRAAGARSQLVSPECEVIAV